MKKIIILIGALFGFLAACTQHEEINGATDGKEQEIRLTLSLPEITMTPLTRIAGVEEQTRFIIEAWKLDEASQAYTVRTLRMEKAGSATTADFNFKFEEKGLYRILVWADYIPVDVIAENGGYIDGLYNTNAEGNGLKAITVKTDDYTPDVNRDAFYGCIDLDSDASDLLKLTLQRAVGKLVLSEKEEQAYTVSQSLKATYSIPVSFDVESGLASGSKQIVLSKTLPEIPVKDDRGYCVLYSDYILSSAGDAGWTITDFDLEGTKRVSGEKYAKEVPAELIVMQNKRTLVCGKLMLVEDVEILDPDDITADFEGNGTVDKPYQISSTDDLRKLMKLVNGGTENPKSFTGGLYADAYYRQEVDINITQAADVAEKVKIVIGTSEHPFRGIYDGNGKSVSGQEADGKVVGLLCNIDALPNTAMFGVVENATLKNIRLTVGNQSKGEATEYSAGVCGIAKGVVSIENTLCRINNITCVGKAVAGVCALVSIGAELTVKGCKVEMVGNSGVKGESTDYQCIGGIIGLVQVQGKATVTDSYNAAKIAQKNDNADYMGGICAANLGNLTVENCYNIGQFAYVGTANVLAGTLVGGSEALVGVTINDSYFAHIGGKNAKAKFENGVKFGANKWPAWDLTATAWGNLGTFEPIVYPTLDWE